MIVWLISGERGSRGGCACDVGGVGVGVVVVIVVGVLAFRSLE